MVARNTLLGYPRIKESKIQESWKSIHRHRERASPRSLIVGVSASAAPSRATVIDFHSRRDAATIVPQPTVYQDCEEGGGTSPGAVGNELPASRCAQ